MNEILPWTLTNISTLKLQDTVELTSIYQYLVFPTRKKRLTFTSLVLQFHF